MRYVAIAGDLVGGVDDDHAPVGVVGQYSGDLAEHGRLSDAGFSEQKDALAGDDEVFDHADRSVNGASDPQRETDDLSGSIANGRDAVEGSLDACAVVFAEAADTVYGVLKIVLINLGRIEQHAQVSEPRLRFAPKVEHDLQKLVEVLPVSQRTLNMRRKFVYENFQIEVYVLLQSSQGHLILTFLSLSA